MSRAYDVSQALATLHARWGSAAPRPGGATYETEGALARALAPVPLEPFEQDAPGADDEPRGPVVVPDSSPRTPAPAPLGPAVSRPGHPAADAEGRFVPT